MAGSRDEDHDRLMFESTDIEDDSVPFRKPTRFLKDKSDGIYCKEQSDAEPSYNTALLCDSIASTDSGISSIRSKSTIPSITSTTNSGISSSTSSFSQSSDGYTLSSQFNELKLSNTPTSTCDTIPSSTLESESVTKGLELERIVNEEPTSDIFSSTVQNQGYTKDTYSGGLKLTDKAYKPNQDGDMSLHLAIIFMNSEVALILISLLPVKYINHYNNLLQTPLHLSVLTRQPRVTRALLMAGASLEAPDRNGNTALHLACLNNFMDCAGALTHRVSVAEYREFLGDKKPLLLPQTPQSLEVKNYEGYTCTHIATFNENFQLLAYLVHLGANISAADDKSGRRPIHYAVELGNLELTTFIVSRLSANVNATTFDLNTPLHVAAGRDLHRLVYFLLESGASRNAINCEGLTPYQVAKSDIMKSALRTVEYNDFTICGGGAGV
ncbi:NF-kappaB inhibitor-like protein [Apostichopus japonicus]|uniref:NF-kappaB inhibitor-like protein n=1 Tax=Stichopus japonicus TaxID=307972 RepID=A0A2G8LR48_STIJA|nr:NF-kappaB inhibitor-like protein [Apostichopus japonicus]